MQLRILIFIAIILSGSALMAQDTICKQQELGNIEFNRNSAKLTAAAKAKLDSLIILINRQPTCEVLSTSSSADLCSTCGALSWDRQEAVISYLLKKGVSEKRFRPLTRLDGDLDFITLTLTSLPLTDSIPYPRLQRRPISISCK